MNNNYKDEQNDRFQQALNMPSLTRDAIDPAQADDIEQHYNEDNRFPSLAGGYQQDPYSTGQYKDDWEQPVQELGEGNLPTVPTVNNHNLNRLS